MTAWDYVREAIKSGIVRGLNDAHKLSDRTDERICELILEEVETDVLEAIDATVFQLAEEKRIRMMRGDG